MGNFFSSLLHNLSAAVIGALPAVLAFAQAGPKGGVLVYVTAHPWAGAIWTLATYALTMAARDLLKNVPAFATASLNPLILPAAIAKRP
jgi:ABC-type sugar transport system substrate-binding protein